MERMDIEIYTLLVEGQPVPILFPKAQGLEERRRLEADLEKVLRAMEGEETEESGTTAA